MTTPNDPGCGSSGVKPGIHVDEAIAWHQLTPDEVATRLTVDADAGLTSQEVAARLESFGPNRLLETPPPPPWSLFFAQFRSALILVLIGAVVLSAAIGNIKDALVIFAVIILNALVGFYQEFRAEQSLAALKKMLPVSTHVRRDMEKQAIDADQLVPGDAVLLEAGDQVPADGPRVV